MKTAYLYSQTDELMHYGVPRRSGRYPWGSGENPYQHSGDFLSRVTELKKSGMTEPQIAKEIGLTTTQLRTQVSLAKSERRAEQVATAKSMREDGHTLTEIAERMGFNNESSVRSLLNETSEQRMNKAQNTADKIREAIETKGMIDVGTGVERELGVSKEVLNQALYILEREGYPVYGAGVPQATNPGKQTNIKVICPIGTEHKQVYDYKNINSMDDYISYDGGESFRKSFEYPSSLNSKRLQIRYAEDGGVNKDGVIEIRRGVEDLSLGNSHYAQVRIMVDGTHYLKGMAVYSDDLPDGVDVRFNTNKHTGTPTTEVLKKIKDDPSNPFGSLIKEHGGQSYYDDPKGKYTDPLTGKKQSLSLINKRAEEGDWGSWSDKLPSQFLAKQNISLVKKQLKLTKDDKQAEFDEICALTNPTVKKALLASFANDCDASAVHLKAAALPRQKYQVILPLETIKDNQVYAPNYKDGETVALVRYPHAGTFEIPILTVNNKQKEGKSTMGSSPLDAIGISKNVADRLSGADFDGDTVMVIPCNSSSSKIKITSTKALKGLEGFDTKDAYGPSSSDPVKTDKNGKEYYVNPKNGKTYTRMSKAYTQKEMGVASNLIADMTVRGADTEELARAVKYSMVVIDAEKHKLDYKQCYTDNNIAGLKKKYQGHIGEDGKYHEGASTLLTRAKSEQRVLKRKGSAIVNDDGSLSWKTADNLEYTDKNGKKQVRTQVSTKMAETKDARTLISDTNSLVENAYADYANSMKSLANQARLEIKNTGRIAYSKTARETYSAEVSSLKSKLDTALRNAPRERKAQVLANATVKAKKEQYPDMTKAERKKVSQQALSEARVKVGAKRTPVEITDREWEAIQAGAISENVLTQILNNTDTDRVRQLATPRTKNELSPAKQSRIKAYANGGYTTSEIANILGVSTSTVTKYLNQ